MPLTSKIIETLPRAIGIYMMRDIKGKIIYIGKALDLRSRVRAYLGQDKRPFVKHIAENSEKVDFFLTNNEKEALLLENQLIKAHRPRYNVLLKDDKTYVSIKVTTAHDYPAILVTRKILKDGSRYFGPYSSARATRDTLSAIGRIFPVRRCRDTEFINRSRPCLYYQIGLCTAPCVKKHAREDYKNLVDDLILFLEGRNTELVRTLEKRMEKYSSDMEFERAAKLRDQIQAINATLVPQAVSAATGTDADIFGCALYDDRACIAVLRISSGSISDVAAFSINSSGNDDFMTNVIMQFYMGGRDVPPNIYVKELPAESSILAEALSEIRGTKVSFTIPKRGKASSWLEMASSTAAGNLAKGRSAFDEIAIAFKLRALPWRIECYDISNLGDSHAVGSRAVFTGGEPDKSLYRHYRIRNADGQNDFSMMYEVLSRRFSDNEDIYPDLIIIDGGKGQLAICLKALSELGISGIPAAGMAKQRPGARDRFFLPGRKDPIQLPLRSAGLQLLQRLRDETHRFGITYHRKLRSKSARTQLENIPGIGIKKAALILKAFPEPSKASLADLKQIKGITERDASGISDYFKKNLEEKMN